MVRQQNAFVVLGSTLSTTFTSFSTTAAPTAVTGTPAGSVYTDANLAGQSTAMGVTVTITAISGVTGEWQVRIVCTEGNSFASNTHYHVRITYVISGTTYPHYIDLHVG